MRETRRSRLLGCLVPLAFTASCAGFLGPAMRLLDPMTHAPVTLSGRPFPILIVRGDTAWVEMVDDPSKVPPPPSGATYLVPEGEDRALEQYLRERDPVTPARDSTWVLRVSRKGPDRQHIQLFLKGDGFWGGGYDATATAATPRYRKVAGPGFAFLFGPLALGLNLACWAVVGGGVWLFWRRRRVRSRVEPGQREVPARAE